MAFLKEQIPNDAKLFLRIHETLFVPAAGDPSVKRPSSACFKDPRLSVNWAAYSTTESTAKPSSAAVVAFLVEDCISLGQKVEHDPIQEGETDGPNQAHSEVCGAKDKVIRDKFVRLSKIEWRRDTLSG